MREKTGKQINVPLDKIIIIKTSKPKKRIEERERELRSDKKLAKKKERFQQQTSYTLREGGLSNMR